MLTRSHALRRRLSSLVLLAVLAFVDCTLARSLVLDRHALRAHSTPGTARIAARSAGLARLALVFSGPDPTVTYAFRAGGKQYEHTQHVTLRTYEALPLGATVCITYLSRDPHLSALAGSITPASILVPALALVGLNATIATAWVSLYRASRRRRFAGARRPTDRELPFPPARRVVLL